MKKNQLQGIHAPKMYFFLLHSRIARSTPSPRVFIIGAALRNFSLFRGYRIIAIAGTSVSRAGTEKMKNPIHTKAQVLRLARAYPQLFSNHIFFCLIVSAIIKIPPNYPLDKINRCFSSAIGWADGPFVLRHPRLVDVPPF